MGLHQHMMHLPKDDRYRISIRLLHINDCTILIVTNCINTAFSELISPNQFVSDIAIFVLKRDVKLQLTNQSKPITIQDKNLLLSRVILYKPAVRFLISL